MHVTANDFLLALIIGAEVFAVAALWPLSEWAVVARKHPGLVVALVVIAACVTLTTLGFVPPLVAIDSWRWMLGHAIGWVPMPLFIGLPNAVCVASGQSLACAGVSARRARVTALAVAGMALVVEPFATLMAGCGLSAACS
jgi:hypothetical protein